MPEFWIERAKWKEGDPAILRRTPSVVGRVLVHTDGKAYAALLVRDGDGQEEAIYFDRATGQFLSTPLPGDRG